MEPLSIITGWDPREITGFHLFQFSALRRTTRPLQFTPLREAALRYANLYWRPHEQRGNQLWCPISDAPMATAFANSRFLVPWLASSDLALFADGADMLVLDDIASLFALADGKSAIQVVKREEYVTDNATKMDSQQQVPYPRKGWSSLTLWNLRHPAHRKLTLEDVNSRPGRDLHAFYWLKDREIGDLPSAWNWFVGVDPINMDHAGITPKLLHYTLGTPEVIGDEHAPWADVWRNERMIMDASRSRLPVCGLA